MPSTSTRAVVIVQTEMLPPIVRRSTIARLSRMFVVCVGPGVR